MKKLLFWLLVLTLSSCATVADLRSRPPDRVLESNLSPKQIANCVLHEAPEKINTINFHHIFNLTETPSGSYFLRVDSPYSTLGEAIFRPGGHGKTIVEFKTAWNFGKKDAFWSCIQRCASKSKE